MRNGHQRFQHDSYRPLRPPASFAPRPTSGTLDIGCYEYVASGSAGIGFNTSTASGDESVTPVSLPVTLSATSTGTITVNYAVTGGTATGSGTDYTLSSGTLTFSAGDMVKNIPLTVTDDTLSEDGETVIVTLSSPSGGVLGSITSQTYTINDNDPVVAVQFSGTASYGQESAGTVNIPVSLSAVSGRTVTVNYAVSGGTATSGTDFTLGGSSVTFTPGQTTANIPVTITNDSLAEGDETIILTLSSPTNATLGAPISHTFEIKDNDVPVAQFQYTAPTGSEAASPATLTVTLSYASASTVTVDYAVTGGTATPGADYLLVGATHQTVALKRTAGLTQGGASTLGSPASMTATSRSTTSRTLAWAARVAPATTTTARPCSLVITPSWASTWSAIRTPPSTRLSCARCTAGNTAMSFAGVKSHDWVEGNKAGNYPGAAPAAPGVCWSHPAGTYTAGSGASGWGAASNAMFDSAGNGADLYGFTNFTSAPAGAAWCVADTTSLVQDWACSLKPNYGLYVNGGNHNPYLSEQGTADQPVLFLDCDLQSGTLTFTPGQTSKTIQFNIVNDGLTESNETFLVTASHGINCSINGTANVCTYTIQEGAGLPTVQFSAASSSGSETTTSANTCHPQRQLRQHRHRQLRRHRRHGHRRRDRLHPCLGPADFHPR